MIKQSQRKQVRQTEQEPTGGRKQIKSAKAKRPAGGGEQLESAKAKRPAGGGEQLESAKAKRPAGGGEQLERAKARQRTRGYKQVERAKAQERTREALIEAATNELFEGNWLKSTLDSLSRKAGVTRQTLLRHFGSKDGLLMQSLMHGASQMRDQRWGTSTTDIGDAVENVIDHYEQWGERSMRIGAWQRGPTVLALFSNAARQIHYDWVEHAFANWLEQFDDETRVRRRAVLIVLCDVQTWWTLSNDLGLPRKEVHAILTEQIGHVLGER